MSTYTKHLSEPWFSLIKIGAKKCEGRLNKGDFAEMKKGDSITFTNSDFGLSRSFCCKITSTHNYETFAEYLDIETLEKCLPGIDTLEQGVKIYHEYYKPAAEREHNVRAFRLRVSRNC